jgi:hypothetical protein
MGWETKYQCKFDESAYPFDVGVFDSILGSGTDGVVFSDARSSVAAALALADGVKFADSKSVGMTSVRADGFKLADAQAFTVGLSMADGIKLSESFNRVWNAYITITDAVVFSEGGTANMPNRGSGNLWSGPMWTRDMVHGSALFSHEASATAGIWTDVPSSTVGTWSKATAASPFWTKDIVADVTWS